MARKQVDLNGVVFVEQDVSLPFKFSEKVDYIIHAATPVTTNGEFDSTMNIIVNGTQNVLDYASRVGCKRILHISSGAIYGAQPESVYKISENESLKSSFYDVKNAYGTGKRISELLVFDWAKKENNHASVARCFAFSGKHLQLDGHLAIGNFVRDALSKKEIQVKGDGTTIRSYLDAHDLVEWLMTILLSADNGEIFNVGSDYEVSMKQLAELIAKLNGETKVNIQNQSSVSLSTNRYIPNVDKAKKMLHLEQKITLEQSLKKMLDFNKGSI